MNAVALPRRPGTAMGATTLYVSPEFQTWETDRPERLARDVTVTGVAYRALDPEYYAWLRHRMTRAKESHVAGHMTAERFEELREAFNGVHAEAMARFNEHDLLRALDRLRPKHYDEPRAFRGARDVGDAGRSSPCRKAVSPRAVAQVDAIRDQAFALGWSHDALYATHGRFAFPCGQDYGLVCFLDDEDRIGNVTREYVEVLRDGKTGARWFYRPHGAAVGNKRDKLR